MSGKELRHANHGGCSEAKRAASILSLQLSAKCQQHFDTGVTLPAKASSTTRDKLRWALFRRRHSDVLEYSSLAETIGPVVFSISALWPLAVMACPASAVPFPEHEAPRCLFQANESAAREHLSTRLTLTLTMPTSVICFGRCSARQ